MAVGQCGSASGAAGLCRKPCRTPCSTLYSCKRCTPAASNFFLDSERCPAKSVWSTNFSAGSRPGVVSRPSSQSPSGHATAPSDACLPPNVLYCGGVWFIAAAVCGSHAHGSALCWSDMAALDTARWRVPTGASTGRPDTIGEDIIMEPDLYRLF
jgi:hypothetical protein